ncbi:MAG: outer membrane lipoprotein-sorting protein [Spirochaetaceae bacterium]|nr:MAG: outer membrane lipoprotein-sorting protein [Spirochaetaceae bacterium]
MTDIPIPFRRWIITFAIALLVPTAVPAQTMETHQQRLQRVDANLNIVDTDLQAEYTIEKRDPGGSSTTTVAAVFRRDRTEQFLVLVLEPAVDKGRGYLKSGDNIWLYDPADRTFTFTSARDRFQNSSIRTSDFERSNLARDYRVTAATRESLGRFDTVVLDLEATTNRAAFPRIRIWVSEDDLVRKREDYSLSGQLLRTTAIPSYQRVGNRSIPAQMVILDHLVSRTINGRTVFERTTVTIRNPSLAPLADAVFTRDYLERVTR